MIDAQESTDPDWVTLFHGTSGDAADSIRREGLCFVNLDAEANIVANEFNLDVDELRALADSIGYTEVAHARTTSVSFAGQRINAALYSGVVGGEARREFYQAAWLPRSQTVGCRTRLNTTLRLSRSTESTAQPAFIQPDACTCVPPESFCHQARCSTADFGRPPTSPLMTSKETSNRSDRWRERKSVRGSYFVAMR